MSPPEDFDTVVTVDQVKEVYSKEEDGILISTCMTHFTVNYAKYISLWKNGFPPV